MGIENGTIWFVVIVAIVMLVAIVVDEILKRSE